MISLLTIAIDPGQSGGIAARFPDGRVSAWAMPDTDTDRLALIRELRQTARLENWRIESVIEKVGGYIGGKGQPGAAMFRFGESFGFLLGALMALEIPLRLIRPQQWQAALQLGTSRAFATKPAWKRHLRDEASRRFPSLRPTLATADALLLLDAAPLLSAPPPAPDGAEPSGSAVNRNCNEMTRKETHDPR